MSKNVADQLVETLVQTGIKHIYAITGDSLNEVNNAVRLNGNIKWIHVRHEETGAFAAGAESQLTEHVSCCAGSSGPGHVHLINGLYDAYRTRASVVAIASTCASTEFGTNYFQETDPIRLFDDCSCYNQMAVTTTELPRMLQSAIQHAISLRSVSVIGVPGDLTSESHSDAFGTAVFPQNATLCPSEESLRILADLLNSTLRITLFCGVGCRHAHEEVLALSRKLNAPVVYTFKGKMDVQYDNPNEVGMTGLLGLPSGYHSMYDSDLLLMLGTDFPYTDFIPNHIPVIQIDLRAENLGRRAKIKMGLQGDIKTTLKVLLPLIQQKNDGSFLKKQLKNYEQIKLSLSKAAHHRGEEGKINPKYVMNIIDQLAADDAIFTVDTGMNCVWSAHYLRANGKRRMIGSFNHGSMANAMPQSIGASLAYPGRQVIALCGDGGISMLLGDLETIVQYALPVKLVVFNNHALGMVKLEMEVAGLPDWQTDMVNPDFAVVAKAMGINSFTVSAPEEVETVLKQAFAMDGPVLIDVLTSSDTLFRPAKVIGAEAIGLVESMSKLMMGGRDKEVMDIVEANK